jgi:hypothetical protein
MYRSSLLLLSGTAFFSSNPNQYVGFFNRPREVVLEATARF